MAISGKYLLAALTILTVLISAACGMKADPIAPEKVLIPKVGDLKGVLAEDTVILSWSPSMNYNNNKPLELTAVEIYLLEQDVSKTLSELQKREAEQEEARAAAGLVVNNDIKMAAGELATTINLLKMSAAQGFQKDARLLARIPVEQLLDLAENGKVFWKGKFEATRENKVKNRSVYAIREVDSFGKRSDFSNFIHIYPFISPPSPDNFSVTYNQKGLNILWSAPERDDNNYYLALLGYNIYKADAQAEFSNTPINETPLTYTAPIDWKDVNLNSYQRVKGQSSNYAMLINTKDEQGASGISQSIYSAGEINQHIGQEVDVKVSIRSIGKASPGRIILDASRDPKLTRIADENAVFRYDQDPLVQIHNIAITDQLKEFTLTGKVPVGAKGYQIIIEPRGWSAVSGSFIIESVKVTPVGRNENLIRNGDFSASPALSYTKEIENFGGNHKYMMTALYQVAGFSMESKPTEVVEISLKDTFAPDSPTGVNAQATYDSVSITWNHSKSADVDGYLVFRRARDERKFTKLTPQPIKNTIFRDRDVTEGTIYFYQIRAVDKAGNTSKDAEADSVEILKRK